MKIFVLRHGHAEPEAPADHLRALSSRGREQVAQVSRENIDSLSSVDLVMVSPYLRAQQTAEVALGILPKAVKKVDSDLLVPGANPNNIVNALYDLHADSDIETVLLVSHQPFVGTLIDMLCDLEPGRYRMGTASLAAIETDLVAAKLCKLTWLKHAN